MGYQILHAYYNNRSAVNDADDHDDAEAKLTKIGEDGVLEVALAAAAAE